MIILLYHGISNKEFTFNCRTYLPKSLFLKEIIYLKKKNYKFITLTKWFNIVKNKKKITHRYVILTFDDGFRNVIDNAYPIIKKYDAKGCFYIVSDFIGNNKLLIENYLEIFLRNHKNSSFKFKFKNHEIQYSLNSEMEIKKAISDMKNKIRTLSYKERISHLNQFYLSNDINNFQQVSEDLLIANWEEYKLLDQKILEIGGHTKTHIKLEVLNKEEEFYAELYESKVKIEKEIGRPIVHLCYPVGSYNKNVIQYAKRYGYLTGVTVNYGFNSLKTDLYQLKRINLENDFILFKYKISGLYSFLKKRFNLLS